MSVGVCARCRCLSFGACQNLWACRRRQTWRRSLHKQKGRGVTQSRPGGAGKAVARRDAGRGKGGGAARAAARASARVARAGREREGRAGEPGGAGGGLSGAGPSRWACQECLTDVLTDVLDRR